MAGTVLITGGTGGLGAAVVETFAADGWRVVAPVRPGTAGRLPAGTVAVEADLTVAEDVENAMAVAAGDAAAPLRAVVNTVGGYAGSGLTHETGVDAFEQMIRVNLRPTYLVTQSALPRLVAAGGGAIVCVSSRAALKPFALQGGYCASKAAVLAFAKALDAEYGGYFTLGRGFAKLVGNPTFMKQATRYGLPRTTLMRFTLKLMANLTDEKGGDGHDRIINALAKIAPDA